MNQNGTLTHWKKLHNPDYIGVYALEPGQELIVTIKSVGVESVINNTGKKEDCMVVHFTEPDVKPLICNVTNSKSITKALGTPYIQQWTGGKIQLYAATVNAYGEEVEAIRVRPIAPKTIKPELTPDHAKWDGAVKNLAAGTVTIESIRKHMTVSDDNATKLSQLAAAYQEEIDAT